MNGASEPESAAEDGPEGRPGGEEGLSRREAMQRAAKLGLTGLTVVALGGTFARKANADPNCNNPKPEGGVYHDSDCGTTQFATDITCAAGSDGSGNRYSDTHCSNYPMSGDADCGGQAGFINGGGGVYVLEDNSCVAIQGRADLDCGGATDATGTTTWGDNTH